MEKVVYMFPHQSNDQTQEINAQSHYTQTDSMQMLKHTLEILCQQAEQDTIQYVLKGLGIDTSRTQNKVHVMRGSASHHTQALQLVS